MCFHGTQKRGVFAAYLTRIFVLVSYGSELRPFDAPLNPPDFFVGFFEGSGVHQPSPVDSGTESQHHQRNQSDNQGDARECDEKLPEET